MLTSIIKKFNTWQVWLGLLFVLGLILRLFGLGQSGIFFYDEAMYLGHSLPGLEFFKQHQAMVAADPWKAILAYLQFPLNFTKPIWIMIVDTRFFFTQIHDWDYAKYASCFFGVLTLPLTFIFARRFFDSVAIALLSVAILAVLPGHVFYSRIGLQEALSAFLVLAGFYFYLFPREFGKGTFLAGLLFGMAYLSNYRLITLPVLLLIIELWLGFVNKEGVRGRHFVWVGVTFLAVMVLVGSAMDGAQLRYTFAWIFHQQDMSLHQEAMRVGQRLWTEALAYPYYLFRLENWLFASAFFASVYFLFTRRWKMALLFVVSCAQMGLFFFASDRGARYIAIVLPFIVMSAAAFLYTFYQQSLHPQRKAAAFIVLVLMFAGLAGRTVQLISDVSGYRPSVEYLLGRDPQVKFLSSQAIVQKLYLKDRKAVADIPVDFRDLCAYYARGYRYLVLDPQAYIAFPSDEHKWSLPLKDHLGFIDGRAPVLAAFPHFNRAVMERVVFEHSDDLFQSIRFLASKDLARMSAIRVYDLSVIVPAMISLSTGKAQR